MKASFFWNVFHFRFFGQQLLPDANVIKLFFTSSLTAWPNKPECLSQHFWACPIFLGNVALLGAPLRLIPTLLEIIILTGEYNI
jgi:hypothetical protein